MVKRIIWNRFNLHISIILQSNQLNTLKENYQSGFFVSQLDYDKLEVQLQQASKTIKKLQELNNKYETEKQNLFEAMNASKEDYSAYKDEKQRIKSDYLNYGVQRFLTLYV